VSFDLLRKKTGMSAVWSLMTLLAVFTVLLLEVADAVVIVNDLFVSRVDVGVIVVVLSAVISNDRGIPL
jgi:hypothetical protein